MYNKYEYLKKIINILNSSHLMSISLIPFFILFFYNLLYYKLSIELFFPLIIFINGVLYHSFFQNQKLMFIYDVITNIIIIIYLIYINNHNIFINIICIIYSFIMFLISLYSNSIFIHIICVQLLFFELYKTECKYFLIP